MIAGRYELDLVEVELQTDDPAMSSWADRYLRPFFPASGAAPERWVVRVSTDRDAWHRARRSFAAAASILPAVVHASLATTYCRSAEGQWHVCQQDPDVRGLCWYWSLDTRARKVEVSALKEYPESKYVAVRTTRELLTYQACCRGWTQVHASCVALESQGLVIVGTKGAGKSAFLTNALRHLGASFVTNDRLLLRRARSGVVAHGLPHSLSLSPREATALLRSPHAGEQEEYYWQPADGGKRRFLASEFCRMMGCPITPECGIALVIFPTFSHGASSLTALEPDDARARLLNHKAPSVSDHQPLWDALLPVKDEAEPLPIRGVQVHYDDRSIVRCLRELI